MAVVCGRYRMVPTLGAIPYTRTATRETSRWHGILHLGVNVIRIADRTPDGLTEIDPIRVGATDLSDIPNSAVRSISGEFFASEAAFPEYLLKDSISYLSRYSAIPTSYPRPVDRFPTSPGEQVTNFVYRNNPSIFSRKIRLRENRRVRIQIPAGTYIVDRVSLYRSKAVTTTTDSIQLPGAVRGTPG